VDPPSIERAVTILRGGGLVAFPTETVYGLGADAANAAAVRHLFAVKGRPPDHPVIVHGGDASILDRWGRDVPALAGSLAERCWPGPLTIVVRRAAHVLDDVTGGLDSVGVRVPDQPIALALLQSFGDGVAAPSANRYGRVSPTSAEDVRRDLGDDVDLVLDGGPCAVGVESTIVDCTTDDVVILRPGGVTRERIEEIVGRPVRERRAGDQRAPGSTASHYAPRARVELVVVDALATRAKSLVDASRSVGVLAMAPLAPLPEGVVALDAPADVESFARVLYARLRAADARELDVLLVVPPPAVGIGIAVGDRLRRAARGEPEDDA